MSIGDAATGLLRNTMFRKRKSWWGDLAMAATTMPIGAFVLGVPDAISALASTIIEH